MADRLTTANVATSSVDLAATELRRYPAERVTFHVAASCIEPQTLAIAMPAGIELERLDGDNIAEPFVSAAKGETEVFWRLPAHALASFSLLCQIAEDCQPGRYEIDAVLLTADGLPQDSATVGIEVIDHARYLQYLPEMYGSDRLMGRFLMLFESFWQPLDRQIGSISDYFDVELTTNSMAAFEGQWVGMTPEALLPEDRRRALIKHAVELYHKRGTRPGLQHLLELVTGGSVTIIEHRAADLVLGSDAPMGHETALGRGNVPHSFTVQITIPTEDWELANWETVLGTLIEREKPAHTHYKLVLEEA